ncbi:hypothetical protein [Streptomyces mirabilis]|uniref:hypothetical protein n=1 Tax=Streptomyces mirabilis TaxID=68239 RepID=UPI0036EC4E7F
MPHWACWPVFVLTAGTGYFVAQEFADVSADRLALASEAEEGDKRAFRALKVLEERAVAAHIGTAFINPQDTKPYMSAKKVPGQTAENPLHRTVSATRRDNNRKAAVKQCSVNCTIPTSLVTA